MARLRHGGLGLVGFDYTRSSFQEGHFNSFVLKTVFFSGGVIVSIAGQEVAMGDASPSPMHLHRRWKQLWRVAVVAQTTWFSPQLIATSMP